MSPLDVLRGNGETRKARNVWRESILLALVHHSNFCFVHLFSFLLLYFDSSGRGTGCPRSQRQRIIIFFLSLPPRHDMMFRSHRPFPCLKLCHHFVFVLKVSGRTVAMCRNVGELSSSCPTCSNTSAITTPSWNGPRTVRSSAPYAAKVSPPSRPYAPTRPR